MSGPRVSSDLSAQARFRIVRRRGEPLFVATWSSVVFIHYRLPASVLQPVVPFELDLWDGDAFVSLVAFTLQRMRPFHGGRLAEWIFKPVTPTTRFLNVRTYVRHRDEPGIYFLAEWLSSMVTVPLGPPLFGLPYRYGRLAYSNKDANGGLFGTVEGHGGRLAYEGRCDGTGLEPARSGSLTEFLLERYTAFTRYHGLRRLFRIWHPPWPQQRLDATVTEGGLIHSTGEWFRDASFAGANYSPGVDVWMGRPFWIRDS